MSTIVSWDDSITVAELAGALATVEVLLPDGMTRPAMPDALAFDLAAEVKRNRRTWRETTDPREREIKLRKAFREFLANPEADDGETIVRGIN